MIINGSIQIIDSTYDGKIKFLQYNIDRAVPHELTNPFEKRSERIKNLINEVDADIVNLQELRELTNTTPVYQWLASFAPKYRFVIGFRNPGMLAFGQATLYKSSRFFPMETQVKWLSDTPNVVSDGVDPKGFGCIAVSTQFVPCKDGKVIVNAPAFWVDNLHFPLDELAKTKCCQYYVKLITSRKEETIVSGDLNFFPDGDAANQRKIMTTQGKLTDLGVNQVTLIDKKEWKSTFVGFDCDKFKAPLDTDRDSRLDHIMATKNIKHLEEAIVLYTKTMLEKEPKELSSRDLPSDHLPLVALIQLPCSL